MNVVLKKIGELVSCTVAFDRSSSDMTDLEICASMERRIKRPRYLLGLNVKRTRESIDLTASWAETETSSSSEGFEIRKEEMAWWTKI